MERKKMTVAEIDAEVAKLAGWSATEVLLTKRFEFANFAAALDFVNQVGEIAERHDHHPDITFGWGYAEIALTTHDRGGITAFDFAVAKEVEELGR